VQIVDSVHAQQFNGVTMMSYEDYLDEVTTLMSEFGDLTDPVAIKYVMRAQQDARVIFKQRYGSRPDILENNLENS
jgi:hypothetical protein